MGVYEIDINVITNLDERGLPNLIKRLLIAEGFKPNDFSVCSNTKDADGGIDVILQQSQKAPLDILIPSTQTVIQLKATEMSATSCVAEINSSSHDFLRDKLLNGYDFVIISSKNVISLKKKEERQEAMQVELEKIGATHTKPIFLDAEDLQNWVNQHQDVVFSLEPEKFRLWNQVGAETFEEWKARDAINPFQSDDNLRLFVEEIKTRILQNTVSNISGLAGIGKTRTVLEACNQMSNEDKNRIIYISKCELSFVIPFLRTLDKNKEFILIIDECDKDDLGKLRRMLSDTKITLVTIDYDSYDESNELKFNKLSNEVISAIVKQVAPEIVEHIRLAVVNVADGFPRFAIHIAQEIKEAISRGEVIKLGHFRDEDIYKLLLRDRKGKYEKSNLDILMVFSLFTKIGCMPGMVRADNRHGGWGLADPNEIDKIIEVFGFDKNKVFEVYNEFCGRKIIQQKGFSISVQPFPLALHLARKWKDKTHSDTVNKYYEALPFALQERFMKRIKYLDNVRDFVKSFIGDKTSPFSNAELLNSPSNELFGQLAEIAPDLAMRSLEYAFDGWTDDDMRTKLTEHRRRIVWTLEKIMFHQELYERAATLLFRLAKGENENIGNNATGVLVQTMQVFLAPTEASLEQRANWLRSLIPEFRQGKDIILKMLDKGLDNGGHYSCMAGPESQGGRTLQYYKPKTWPEVETYFDMLGNILLEINNTADDEIKRDLLKIIGDNINPLMMNGLFEKYEPLVSSLLIKFPDYIPTFVANSRFNHDKGFENLTEYRAELLAKADRDLEALFELYIVPSEWDVLYSMETENKLDPKQAQSLMKKKSEEIADAYLNNLEHLYNSLSFFISKNAGNINDFASRIGSHIEDYKVFVNRLMDLHMAMDNDNFSLLAIAMHEIWERDPSYIDSVLSGMLEDERWINKEGIIRLVGVIHNGFLDSDLDSILMLLSKKKISLLQLQIGGLSINLRNSLDSEKFIVFLQEVYNVFGTDACQFIVESLDYYKYNGDYLPTEFKGLLINILTNPENLLFIFTGSMKGYHTNRLVHKMDLLPEESIAIFEAFKIAATLDVHHRLQYDNYASETVKYLIEKYPNVMLPHVLEAMAQEESIWSAGWMRLLGYGFNGKYGVTPYLFSKQLDSQIPTYFHDIDQVAQRNIRSCIVEIVSLLDTSNEQINWSPIIKYFIDTAVTEEDLEMISLNINNFTWWGNSSDYYGQYVPLFQDLTCHSNPVVCAWARKTLDWLNECIILEKAKEEELGY